MGWSERHAFDHIARLAAAGFLTRVPMTRGDGSLLVVTKDGAAMAGFGHLGAPRSVAPTTWAHASATAWVAASFDLSNRSWVSERELRHDPRWDAAVTYKTGEGGTRTVRHRPDLGSVVAGERPLAIEVELQQKSTHRLRGILAMYERRIADGQLGRVLYVTGPENVHNAIVKQAAVVGLTNGLRTVTLDALITQTRKSASAPKVSA